MRRLAGLSRAASRKPRKTSALDDAIVVLHPRGAGASPHAALLGLDKASDPSLVAVGFDRHRPPFAVGGPSRR